MVEWTAFHKQLRNVLCELVDQSSIIRQVAQDSGLKVYSINFNNASESIWQYVIEEAIVQESLPELFQEMRLRFPRSIKLAEVYDKFVSEQPLRSNYKPPQWNFKDIDDDELEKLMGPVPTFLPVAYLYAGWIASQSVVRICLPQGCATGFLIDEKILMTNNHVLPSQDIVRESHIDCDYQVDIDGLDIAPVSYFLDSSLFRTDKKLDITVVGVRIPKEVRRSPLRFADQAASINERVSIIQHPEGGRKQVALHKNFVLYSDSEVLQYLTDTLPGSSGSPIFNSHWQVVGIHRAGGHVLEPKTEKVVYRNQGTALPSINVCLRNWGINLNK